MDEIKVKVYICGELGVGKTSLIRRLVKKDFLDRLPHGMLKFDYTLIIDDTKLIFTIRDFKLAKTLHYIRYLLIKDAEVILLCYDPLNLQSFERLSEWYSEILKNTENPLIYLIGTKSDISTDEIVVKEENIKNWTKERKVDGIYNCSAKTGENIAEIFENIAKDYIKKHSIITT